MRRLRASRRRPAPDRTWSFRSKVRRASVRRKIARRRSFSISTMRPTRENSRPRAPIRSLPPNWSACSAFTMRRRFAPSASARCATASTSERSSRIRASMNATASKQVAAGIYRDVDPLRSRRADRGRPRRSDARRANLAARQRVARERPAAPRPAHQPPARRTGRHGRECARLGARAVAARPSPGRVCAGARDASRQMLRERSIPVVDDLANLTEAPDIIHGSHTPTIIESIVRFPHVPALQLCQSAGYPMSEPLFLPQVRRFVAVDENTRDYLSSSGVAPGRIRVIHNAVDLRRIPIARAAAAGPPAQRAHLHEERRCTFRSSRRRAAAPASRSPRWAASPAASFSIPSVNSSSTIWSSRPRAARSKPLHQAPPRRDGRARACRDGDARERRAVPPAQLRRARASGDGDRRAASPPRSRVTIRTKPSRSARRCVRSSTSSRSSTHSRRFTPR